jgi:protein involved in polysaccharide export with SLBB domain
MAMIGNASAGRIVRVALGVALIAGCAAPAIPEAPAPAEVQPAAVEPGDDALAGYRLGAGDRLRLTVFRHEDLSGEFEVDGEGAFAMPLVASIAVLGLTPRGVERQIEAELTTQGYLVDPQVSVEVLNYRPFYVLGEVRNPGSYAYADGMSVTLAVTLAGGFSHRAAEGDITVTRGGVNGRTITVALDSEILPGDIIEVPERFL